METGVERDCEFRAEGLRAIVEALRIALTDWQELQARAKAEGVDVSGQAKDIRQSLEKAARLISEAA